MIWLSVNFDRFIAEFPFSEKILLLIAPLWRGDYRVRRSGVIYASVSKHDADNCSVLLFSTHPYPPAATACSYAQSATR